MIKQPTKIPWIVLPGIQGWDIDVPYPFRTMPTGTLCVAGVSIKGDVVAVQAEYGQSVELYPTDLIESISTPTFHINA